ncbi:MAG: hypothetical protein NZO16_05700 [Deltaproteobacteria bacterium]|nr:hypothetical protein [Deltaproteobacteria bacterium]
MNGFHFGRLIELKAETSETQVISKNNAFLNFALDNQIRDLQARIADNRKEVEKLENIFKKSGDKIQELKDNQLKTFLSSSATLVNLVSRIDTLENQIDAFLRLNKQMRPLLRWKQFQDSSAPVDGFVNLTKLFEILHFAE